MDNSFFIPDGVSGGWKWSLRERVEFLLKSKGMTFSQLADLIGINKGTLSKIVNRDWSPTSKIMLLMGKHLQVDTLVIFGDEKYFLDYLTSIKKIDGVEDQSGGEDGN